MHAVASMIENKAEVCKSVDTGPLVVWIRMPSIGPAAAVLMALRTSSISVCFESRHVKSTPETSGVANQNAMAVSLPFNSGSTLETVFAAFADDGLMFQDACHRDWAGPKRHP